MKIIQESPSSIGWGGSICNPVAQRKARLLQPQSVKPQRPKGQCQNPNENPEYRKVPLNGLWI